MRSIFSKIVLAAIFGFALTFTFSCSGGDDDGGSSGGGGGGSCVGDKGNNMANYKTKQIGSKTWMLENLNYNVAGSRCYGEGIRVMVKYDIESGQYIYSNLSNAEIEANNAKYGRLYDWETAMKVCPSGWHLASDDDWQELFDFVGGIDIAGEKLKAKSGWDRNGNGTDDFEFSALPGGIGYPNDDGYFGLVGMTGLWYSNADGYVSAYSMVLNRSHVTKQAIPEGTKNNPNLLSVRCVKN